MGAQSLGHLLSGELRPGKRKGEIVAFLRRGDGPGILPLPHEQTQQGGFPPPVSADQAQAPVGVQLDRQVLEHWVIAALIGKREVRNINQSHKKIASRCRELGTERPRSTPDASIRGVKREKSAVACQRAQKTRRPSAARLLCSSVASYLRILSPQIFYSYFVS